MVLGRHLGFAIYKTGFEDVRNRVIKLISLWHFRDIMYG